MNKISKVMQSITLAAAAFLMVFLFSVNTEAASTGTVYFAVEKFTIGQGYLVEPCQVAITEGEKISDVTERVLKQKGYQYDSFIGSYGWYLDGIKNADTGIVKVPSCVQTLLGGTLEMEDDHDLYTNDYRGNAGWLFYQNNKPIDKSAGVKAVHNGDVIRVRFSLLMGCDLGRSDYSDYVNPANLDELTKKMALFNAEKALCVEKGYQSAYNAARSFAENMDNYVIATDDSNKAIVDAKVKSVSDKLPASSTIQTWKAQKAAAEKAAAQKAAAEKIKQNTPAAPKWKSVKAKTGHKAVLTWKKVSNATGYEVYMSTKKSSGYKKIATLKKASKITYTKTKLKKNKKYYFKVRAYKTVSGVKYVSGYSSVKKMKAK